MLKKDVGTNRGEKASEALWHRIQTEEKQSDVDCYLGGAYHCRLKSVCGSDNWSRLPATQSDYKPRWLTSVKQGKWTVLTLHAIFFFFSHERAFPVGFGLFFARSLHIFWEACRSKTADSKFLRTKQALLFPLFCKHSDRYIVHLVILSLHLPSESLTPIFNSHMTLTPAFIHDCLHRALYECYYLRLSRSLPLPLWDTSADSPSSVPGSLLITFVLFLQPVEGGSAVGSQAAVQQFAWRWLAPSGDAVAAGGRVNIFLLGNGVSDMPNTAGQIDHC